MRIAATFCVVVLAASSCRHKPETATFTEPEYGVTISITRQLINPFTGGYDRFVSIRRGDGMSGGLHMIDDALGFGPVNVYRIEGPALLLFGNIERLMIDLETAATKSVDLATKRSGEFVGCFDEDATGTWRFIKASERAELPVP
jgi:hypothetical protein